MGIRTGIIPIPRTTTAASAFGVFSFTGWASATGLGHDCPPWNVGMCRDVSGGFHWRTWSVLETTGSESTRINCCVDRLDFHRKLVGDCKSCLRLCRTVISPLTCWFSCCIILLYSIMVDHFRIAWRRMRVALSASYPDRIFIEPHTTPRTAKLWRSKWWQSFSTFGGFASRFYMHSMLGNSKSLQILPTLLWWHPVNRQSINKYDCDVCIMDFNMFMVEYTLTRLTRPVQLYRQPLGFSSQASSVVVVGKSSKRVCAWKKSGKKR